MIIGIVCTARDYAIGKQNKITGKGQLLFNIPADMQHFKRTTTGNVCVFGKATYDSLSSRPLKHRVNIVLWDKATSIDCLPGAITFSDAKALVAFVKVLSKELSVYICGGASIYRLFLPYYDIVNLTSVDAVVPDATAYFPNLESEGFKLECSTPYYENEKTNGYLISNQLWIRK